MKPIPNFPDYFADKKGNIYSNKRWRGKGIIKLKPLCSRLGYLTVNLYRNKKMYVMRIHRIILETFVGPCPPGMECRHKDGIKAHNKLSNLRWDTHSSNCKDRKKHGTQFYSRGENNSQAILNNLQVRVIKWLLKNTDMYHKEIADIFVVARKTISDINIGRTWRTP